MVRAGGGMKQLKRSTLGFGVKFGWQQKPAESNDLYKPLETWLVQRGHVPSKEMHISQFLVLESKREREERGEGRAKRTKEHMGTKRRTKRAQWLSYLVSETGRREAKPSPWTGEV